MSGSPPITALRGPGNDLSKGPCGMSMWDDQAGYDRADPKHPDRAHASVGMSSGSTGNVVQVTHGGASPAGRLRVLTTIAEHYSELVQPSFGAVDPGGEGAGIPLMPATYTPTVREFERLVRLMRDDRSTPLLEVDGAKVSVRQLAWHLREWHLNAERVIGWVPVAAKNKRGRQVKLVNTDGSVAKRPVSRMRRHPQARESLAVEGLRWVASRWGLAGEPMLPDALRESIAA